MQLDDFVARVDAQRRVEVRQWLVEQEDLRLAHHGAAERHALALAAGKRIWLAREQRQSPSMAAASCDAALDLGLRQSRAGAGRRRGFPSTVMCG